MDQFEIGKLLKGYDYEDYVKHEGLRASDLKLMKRSPGHWKARQEDPKEPTDALEYGKLFHLAMELRENFRDVAVIEPEFTGYTQKGELSPRSKEAKEKRAAWHAGLPQGKVVVPNKWYEPLVGMVIAISKHRLVKNLMKNGVAEHSLWVTDEDTGQTLKCRPDFITEHGEMVDIKTTRDCSNPFFYEQIFSCRYPESPYYILQAAHYAHCAKLSRLCNGDAFIFVGLEKEPPYAIRVWPMDSACLDAGEYWRRFLTKRFDECKKSNLWPTYDERAEVTRPPEWASMPPLEEE